MSENMCNVLFILNREFKVRHSIKYNLLLVLGGKMYVFIIKIFLI